MKDQILELYDLIHKQYDRLEAYILSHTGQKTIDTAYIHERTEMVNLLLLNLETILEDAADSDKSVVAEQQILLHDRVRRILQTDWTGELQL
jgi:hypothetical protein